VGNGSNEYVRRRIDTRYTIGVDRVMVEVDYPHGDGTCPET
jgi:hypothetical protein